MPPKEFTRGYVRFDGLPETAEKMRLEEAGRALTHADAWDILGIPRPGADKAAEVGRILNRAHRLVQFNCVDCVGCEKCAPSGPPNLRRVVAGAVYDFAAGLTTGPEIVAGSKHEAGPVAERCEQFLRERGCSEGEPMVKDWQHHLGAAPGASQYDRQQEALASITEAGLNAGLGFDMARKIADAAMERITKAKVI